MQILSCITIDILLLGEKKLGNALQKAAGCETVETAAVAIGAKWLVNKLVCCGGFGLWQVIFCVYHWKLQEKDKKICELKVQIHYSLLGKHEAFRKMKLISGIKYKPTYSTNK